MNETHIHRQLPSWSSRGQRKTERMRGVHLLVVTSRGTGKIIDIHHNGLSFGCLYPHNFPEIFTIDILNAKGVHLKRITARKTWQRTREDVRLSEEFELEVGVEFLALLPEQESLLAELLENQYPAIEATLSVPLASDFPVASAHGY